MFGPIGIKFHQHAGQLGKIVGVVFCRYDIGPGLLVTAGSGPARGFKKAAQDVRGDGLGVKGPRTPAMAEERVNRVVGWCWFLHWGGSFRYWSSLAVTDHRRLVKS